MSTATDIIADARAYASETYDAAEDLIDDAQSKVSISWAIKPEFDFTVSAYDLTLDAEDPDKFHGGYTSPLNHTAAPTYLNILIPEVPEPITPVEDFDKSDLYSADPPIFDVGDFNKDAPNVSVIKLPTAPEYIKIPFPELRETQTPNFGGVAVPAFEAELLASIPNQPDDIVQAYKDTYSSALPEMKDFINSAANEYLFKYAPEYEDNRERLITKINSAYDNGTGLAESVEQGIYDRGRARAEAEAIRLQNDVLSNADKLGMYVPAGATIAAMQDTQKTVAMANAQYSSETAIEKAKMELNHLQFVMKLSDGIRNNALQMAVQQANIMVQVNGQALQNAKDIANIMTDLYNMQVKRFELALQYISIQAQIYETEFKAAMADLEIFRIEAEVAKLNNDLNQSDVDLYIARIKSQEAEVSIYSAIVNGLSAGVQAEAAAVSAFGQEVNAYKALIDAKSSEFSAYTSALQGNKIKSDIHITEVQAYKAKVDAQVANVNIELENNKAVNTYNASLTDQYKAELNAYIADIKAESTRFDSSIKAYTANLEGYKAELESQLSTIKSKAQVADMDLKAAISHYSTSSQFNISNAQTRNTGSKNVADVAMSGADTYTSIAAAALQAQNTMVQVVES